MKPDINQEAKLISTLYTAGFSMRQVGRKILVSPSTVKRRLTMLNVRIRSSSEGVKLASKQGRLAVPRKKMLS